MGCDKKIWQNSDELEAARIFFANPYIVLSLDNLLPPVIPLENMRLVLDIGCGTGEWARTLAKKHPYLYIVGIDTSSHLIHQARRQAQAEGINSISFLQLDSALDLLAESYDVVHMYSLSSFIMTAMRERIIDEMLRVLKPGGWLNIVDYEQGSTSSPAFNRLSAMGLVGVGSLGGKLIPSSSLYGVAVRLYEFLVDAGMIDVSYTVHAVDYGVNSHSQTPRLLNDLVEGMINFKSLVLMLRLTDSETFDRLVEQAKEELYRLDSCGYAYLISAVGRKDV